MWKNRIVNSILFENNCIFWTQDVLSKDRWRRNESDAPSIPRQGLSTPFPEDAPSGAETERRGAITTNYCDLMQQLINKGRRFYVNTVRRKLSEDKIGVALRNARCKQLRCTNQVIVKPGNTAEISASLIASDCWISSWATVYLIF